MIIACIDWTNIVSLASVLVAIIAAFLALRTNNLSGKTLKVAQEQLGCANRIGSASAVEDMLNRYFEKNLHDAIQKIADLGDYWKSFGPNTPHSRPNDFIEVPQRSKDNNPDKRLGVGKFISEGDKTLRDEYNNGTTAEFPWTKEEEHSRRILKSYFYVCWQLHDLKLINDESFKKLCLVDAICLLFSVVEPMEAIKNADYEYKSFYDIMNILGEDYTKKCEENRANYTARKAYLNDDRNSKSVDSKSAPNPGNDDKKTRIPSKTYLASLP